jgi:Mg2+/Co2+ transporter CorB
MPAACLPATASPRTVHAHAARSGHSSSHGELNKEIAALLQVSVNTVSVHRANLMEALNIHRTAELVVYAIRKGLVTLP